MKQKKKLLLLLSIVTVTDMDTGKNKVIWLTKFNPVNSDTEVSEARIVKITNTRFAILYTTTTNNVSTLNYVLVKDNGKVLIRKTYNDITFTAATQPIIYNGYIVWTDVYTKQEQAVNEWGYPYTSHNDYNVLCKIPVLLDK